MRIYKRQLTSEGKKNDIQCSIPFGSKWEVQIVAVQ